jgi:arylsulfatase B
VPFLARWPRGFPAGKVVDTPVISLDLAATALAAGGIAAAADELDGTDLVSLVKAPPTSPRTFFWRMGQRAALREGDWKIVRDGGPRQAGPWRLFNLTTDIGEANDLAEKEPARLEALVKRWSEWNSRQQEPRW